MTSVGRYADLAGSQPVARSDYVYDGLNRLTSLTHRDAAGQVVDFFDLGYDSADRITSLGDVDGTTSYSYDGRDELTGADHSAPGSPDESYAYDAQGNRTQSGPDGDGYETGPGNRLLSDGTYRYAYDAEGNVIRRTEIATNQVREFQWDHLNRLVGVIDRDAAGATTQEVHYTYDALGRRISKAVDADPADGLDAVFTSFVYDGENVLLDFTDADGGGPGAPALTARYLHGDQVDQVFAQEDVAGQTEWLLPDQLGTVHDVVDNSDFVLNHVRYDSFGQVLSQSDPTAATRYLFTGREYDPETGLYYYRAREYDPALGRFLSEDALQFQGGGENPYLYVLNDPQNNQDPSGLEPVPKEVKVEVEETVLRGRPLAYAPGIATLAYPEPLEVLGVEGSWYHVRTADGREGYVHVSAVTVPKVVFRCSDEPVRMDAEKTRVTLSGKG
jgi:RHS repeat-associated protein